MTTLQNDIERLRAQIALKEARLAEIEQELADLRGELDEFGRVYNARVGAAQAKLEALEAQIVEARAALARRQGGGPAYSPVFAHGYASVEDQFRRAWTRPPAQAEAAPAPRALNEQGLGELRKLYRELARAYHPDLARTPEERETRTRAMAEINAAYAGHDLDGLRVRAGRPLSTAREPVLEPGALVAWLRNENARLGDVLQERERERIALENSALLRLKIETAVARTKGRDLLGETLRLVEVKVLERELELMGLERELQGKE